MTLPEFQSNFSNLELHLATITGTHDPISNLGTLLGTAKGLVSREELELLSKLATARTQMVAGAVAQVPEDTVKLMGDTLTAFGLAFE